jgi:hypothetical protein
VLLLLWASVPAFDFLHTPISNENGYQDWKLGKVRYMEKSSKRTTKSTLDIEQAKDCIVFCKKIIKRPMNQRQKLLYVRKACWQVRRG